MYMVCFFKYFFNITLPYRLHAQRNSVSPADREKYRTRSPLDIENDTKRRKEEKLQQVSVSLFFHLAILLFDLRSIYIMN